MSNAALSLVEFVIALSVLLFLHESGHYLSGRLFGIVAEEFGFGYPPKLLKLFNFAGTDFTLNWIPFGAFVRFKGENDPEAPGGFATAGKWKRLVILMSGSIMNLLTGVMLFAFIISQTGAPRTDNVEIAEVDNNSPAFTAGINAGDILVSINMLPVSSRQEVSNLVQEHLGEEISVTVLRGGIQLTFSMVPRKDPPVGEGPLGIAWQNPVEDIGFLKSIPYGGRLVVEQIRQLLAMPGMLIRGELRSQEMRLLSPKGIYDVYSQVREEERAYEEGQPSLAILNIAWFFGMISVASGFINLLPIPALDGGRIIFLIPELLFNKRVPAKYENMVHMIGYSALLIMMVFLFYQDFTNPVVLPW